jgi:hypothetical protein
MRVLFKVAAVGIAAAVAGECGAARDLQSTSACALAGNTITCVGETFDDCALAGCSIADLNNCPNPPAGCQIAPGMILAHYQIKPPNDFYLCGEAQATCGTWTEATCALTLMNGSGTVDYTIKDPSCP